MGSMLNDITKQFASPFHKLVASTTEGSPDKKDTPSSPHYDVAAKHAKPSSNHVLESIRYWDVTMPPVKKYMVGGYLVPTIKNAFSEFSMGSMNKKRRITIELYVSAKAAHKRHPQNHHRLHERRFFDELLRGISDNNLTEFPTLDDQDIIIFRVLKPIRGDSPDDESEAGGSISNGDLDSRTITTVSLADYGDGVESMNLRWGERYRAKLHDMEILSSHKRTFEMQLGAGDDTIVRDFCFDSKHDADTFVACFEQMRQLQRERGARLAAAHGSISYARPSGSSPGVLSRGLDPTPEEPDDTDDDEEGEKMGFLARLLGRHEEKVRNKISLLIEIVSASNLAIADVYSSDPYVCVRDGKTEWHRTNPIYASLNPVWTLSTLSLFLIETTLAEFFEDSNFLEFIVKDYDSIGEDEILGSVMLSKSDLLKGNGSRHEYELKPHTGKNRVANDGKKANFVSLIDRLLQLKSYLALRFRTASAYDIKFIKKFESNRNRGLRGTLGISSPVYGVYADQSFLGPRPHKNPVLQLYKRKADDGKSIEYRVKPFPDPARPEHETKWLTKKGIEREAMKPSSQWIEAGSGSVGKMYVEVIGCDDIPNLDFSVTGRDKTDPFICIVYEDSIVNTDVINDCLSPRWMPWTQRAFVFNVMHPSSQLYIAVFDHDLAVPGTSPKHDKVGRAVINLTNCAPNTVFTTRYHLYNSDEPDRKKTGTLIIRIRYECTNGRRALLSEFQLKTQYHVATVLRSDFRCAYYALANDKNHQALSLQALTKHVEELQHYTACLDEIADALLTVFLWRGHFPVALRLPFTTKSCTFKLPLHSMVSFGWGVILARDFEKIFSFICFLVAWVLLATMEHRNSNPNPWKHTRSYFELLGVLAFNISNGPRVIEPNENIEEIMEYDAYLEERDRMRKEVIEHTRIEKGIRQKQWEQEDKKQEKQNLDIATNTAGGFTELALAPFKPVLLPAQTTLYNICIVLRAVSSIVIWEDSVAAFWIVTLALTASLILAWIPWSFIFMWSFRIFVWVVLGPWMKLVDVLYVSRLQNMTEEERTAKIEQDYQRRYEMLLGESYLRKLLSENATKIQDIMKYMFGQYLMRVPIFKEQRYHSIPLSSCSARPYNAKDDPPINIVRNVNGQYLSGEMVPKRECYEKHKEQNQTLSRSPEGGGTNGEVPTTITTKLGDAETVPLLDEDEYSNAYGAV